MNLPKANKHRRTTQKWLLLQ